MIKKWLKSKLGITHLEEHIEQLQKEAEDLKTYTTSLEEQIEPLRKEVSYERQRIEKTLTQLKKFTKVDADVGSRSNNTIILTGMYRNKAYVQFYDLGNGEFERLVNQLRDMKDHALIRNIDRPPNFHGMFNL
jgi:predicted RNase H-like nuclease (RuvC/YqgF family)